MAIENPHEALMQIAEKVETENLSVQEMEDRTEQYAKLHEIDALEMAFYPNGDRVIDHYINPKMVQQKTKDLFMGIIAENRTGTPKGIRFPACRKCKRWVQKTLTCSLYLEGIPKDIFWGEETCTGMEM